MLILILDDDPSLGHLFTDYLGLIWRVKVFENPFEFLKAVKSNKAHLYIIDVRLPGMSGAEVIKKIRRVDIRTPILVITGIDSPAVVEPVLQKPFTLSELRKKIEELIPSS